MAKFIEKDIKKACKIGLLSSLNRNFFNNIKYLAIKVSGSSISLKDLEKFPNLEELYIDKKGETYEINDIDVLWKCPKLKSLTLSKCKYFYMPINYFQNLEELDFYETEIEDFSFLRDMSKLTDLILEGRNVRNLEFLKNLPSLKYLALEDTSVRDIEPLKYLENLENIDFEDNEYITDFSVLKTLPLLKEYYLDGDYISLDEDDVDEDNEEDRDTYKEEERKNVYNTQNTTEEKPQKVNTFKLLGIILAPIFYLMSLLVLMLILLKLPNIVPGFFRFPKYTSAETILYPTIISNGALGWGMVLGCIVLIYKNIRWFIKVMKIRYNEKEMEKYGDIGGNLPKLFILGIISIGFGVFLSAAMLMSEDIFGIMSRNMADLKMYKAGEGKIYYGTLQLSKNYGRMEGVYYTGKHIQFKKYLTGVEYPHQGWRAGKKFSLVCPIPLSRNLKLENNADYLVRYLPNTKVVYSIEKLNRWDYINEVLEEDLFKKKLNVSTNVMLKGIFSKGQYLEKNYPLIKEILSGKTKYKIEYSIADLNEDGEEDYLVVLESVNGKKAVMGIIMVNKKYQEVFLPEMAGNKNVVISKLSTKTFYLHDLKVLSTATGEESILQYDGKKNYIRSSRKK